MDLHNLPYIKFEQAVTDTPFTFGVCDAIYVKATITTSSLIGTARDGTTIDLGLTPIGTTIRASFSKVVFAGGPAGAVVAMQCARA